eukprot:2372214-Prymnesium_polylepis.1
MAQLRAMGEAVPAQQGTSDYHTALSDAAVVVGDLRQGRAATWEAARAAISGMPPTPTAAQWAELPDDDDDDAPDDRDIAGNGD